MARQISRKTIAPMVAVIRLPQKSGMTCRFELFEQKAADNGANQPDRNVAEQAAPAAENCVRQPARRPDQ